ncbi:DUF4249 domain-containing protein [Mucilaginibacter sp. HMF5004]|uniref:DUF4249 domain-containing protein n=1 Tax=Mucilaginibacter rivuli TaxID=2857527 RepID=UPI001C5DB760|nr:DUF4249 domain-containing protein [Mucilaginibacter rivuli]MBW4888652.1 DUF4249 domain-containing protein [Mucilaginibacter rivuli]
MTLTIKHWFIILLAVSVTASCTKVIQLQLADDTGKLVIEGNIVNSVGPQTVKLSRNVAFTNTNTYPAVTGATVTITDNVTGNNYRLLEASPGTYTIIPMVGTVAKTYTLNVLTGGQTYTAASVMPASVTLDSLTSKPSTFDVKKRQVTLHFLDPAGVSNQYRFVMFVNGVQVKSVFATNDDFTDGRYVHYDLRQNDIDVYAGDTVTVEMQCIDKVNYTYWYTLARQQVNGPGGGVTPTNPPNNISPDALGYFSAHTTQSRTIVVK